MIRYAFFERCVRKCDLLNEISNERDQQPTSVRLCSFYTTPNTIEIMYFTFVRSFVLFFLCVKSNWFCYFVSYFWWKKFVLVTCAYNNALLFKIITSYRRIIKCYTKIHWMHYLRYVFRNIWARNISAANTNIHRLIYNTRTRMI